MTYIATVRTTRAWLTLATDPTTSPIVCGTRRAADLTEDEDGEIRQYVGGRRQGVTYAPVLRTLPITLIGLSPAQLTLLRQRRGLTVLFRSLVGERLYGIYFGVAERPTQHGTTLNDGRAYDVTITLYETDYDESVTVPA